MRCDNCMKELPTDSASFCPFCGKKPKEENPPHRLAAGTVLHNRYLVGATLGEGGFGITYVGFDQTLYIKVAVKEYYPSGIATRFNTISNDVRVSADNQQDIFDRGKASFLNEARSVAQFSNETGVVDVRDFFTENNTAYIVMEFLDGVDLNKHIHNNGVMEAKQTFEMMLPLMRTLEKMHRQNVIHRDISPDNIMLLKNGTLKLMDFGSARQYSRDESRSLSVVLKPGFAPFEQYSRKGKQGPWTDVYALCATIYACITGKAPSDSLDRSVADDLKKPSELGISIPENLEKALMKGLAVHRENRFRNMGELIAAIKKEPAAETKKPEIKKEERITIAADAPDDDPQRTVSAEEPVIEKKPVVPMRVVPKPVIESNKTQEKNNNRVPIDSAKSNTTSSVNKPKKGKSTAASVIGVCLVFCLICGLIGFIMSNVTRCSNEKNEKKTSSVSSSSTPIATLATTTEKQLSENELKQIRESLPKHTISAGYYRTVGLKSDNKVVSTGYIHDDKPPFKHWNDIVALSAGWEHTIGLKSDGTVVVTGSNTDGQCDVGDWKDIVAVSAGAFHTVGLKADGTVVAVGNNGEGQCDVGNWKDIVAVSAGAFHTVGLKADGTVVATESSNYGNYDVGNWKDIVAVSAEAFHTVGLKADGTVVAVGNNGEGQCDVGNWKDIVAVSAGAFHTVGLKADGTVVATESSNYGNYDVGDWKDIVAVSAGWYHAVGLKSDGTVVAVGWINDVQNWTNIKTN